MDNFKCDFCKTNDSIGVYATDHGPFSLRYCQTCLEHSNVRTIFNACSKYFRFGEIVFDECKERNGAEINVYYKGEYVLLRDLIKNLDYELVENHIPKGSFLYPIMIDYLNGKERDSV